MKHAQIHYAPLIDPFSPTMVVQVHWSKTYFFVDGVQILYTNTPACFMSCLKIPNVKIDEY